MKIKQILLIAGLCLAGFAAGLAGKRLAGGRTEPVSTTDPAQRDKPRGTDTGTGDPSKLPTLRSRDTLETITALDDESLVARLALWLLDAGEKDIAAYWKTYQAKKDRTDAICDLIFINWTRLSPQAAIAAAAATGDEAFAWRAWACHDPKASLAAAIATNPDCVNIVVKGIGEYHPDWLAEHLGEIPESARKLATTYLKKRNGSGTPEESRELVKKLGINFNRNIFAELTRMDPRAAFDWIQKNRISTLSIYGNTDGIVDEFVKNASTAGPDALARLARQLPVGEVKRKIEAVVFANLLKTNPEAAIEQAASTKAPRIAAARLAVAGLSLVKSDPDKAIELSQKLLTIYPDALDGIVMLRHPHASSSSSAYINEVKDLMGQLMDKDPAKAMEMIPPAVKGTSRENRVFTVLSEMWAKRGFVAYVNWVNQQSEPEIREKAASTVLNRLIDLHQFQEATDWAMSLQKTRDSQVLTVLYSWREIDPGEALAWLESSGLPAATKETLSRKIKSDN